MTEPTFPASAESQFEYKGATIRLTVGPGTVANGEGVVDYSVTCEVYGRPDDPSSAIPATNGDPDRSASQKADLDNVEAVADSLVEEMKRTTDEQVEVCESLQDSLDSVCKTHTQAD